jgi:hypothetical protein
MKTYGPRLSDSDDLQVMMKDFTKSYDDTDKMDIVIKGKVLNVFFPNVVNTVEQWNTSIFKDYWREKLTKIHHFRK